MRGVRLYPRWHNYRLSDARCRELVHAAAARGMAISIPRRVEDRRHQSWLVDIPDVEVAEIAGLVRECPEARFILGNGTGFAGAALAGLSNYAVEISLLTAALGNELGALLRSLGEDRLLFGTGMPFHYPGAALAKLELLDAAEGGKAEDPRTERGALAGAVTALPRVRCGRAGPRRPRVGTRHARGVRHGRGYGICRASSPTRAREWPGNTAPRLCVPWGGNELCTVHDAVLRSGKRTASVRNAAAERGPGCRNPPAAPCCWTSATRRSPASAPASRATSRWT